MCEEGWLATFYILSALYDCCRGCMIGPRLCVFAFLPLLTGAAVRSRTIHVRRNVINSERAEVDIYDILDYFGYLKKFTTLPMTI
jgi:hypothetical protein